jgi:hypothetical protein
MQDALRQFKADFFQALAHPTRIAIVEQLMLPNISHNFIAIAVQTLDSH